MESTISKTHHFSASHQLFGLAVGHPCMRMHGHNYQVTLEVAGEVGPLGFVIDYADMKPFFSWIDDILDHHHLNEALSQPTAENLAELLLDVAAKTLSPFAGALAYRVGVSETPKTWAWSSWR